MASGASWTSRTRSTWRGISSTQGKADPDRLIIRGGSAGGYTTLAALAFHPGAFKAGASYYGISDIEVLAHDTHKFESRYLDTLVGPYPDARDLYRARSPIHFVDRLSCALILFQGLEDKVVPPNQSEMMADGREEEGDAGGLSGVRGRAARVSQGRPRSFAASRLSCFSTALCSDSSQRIRSSQCRSTTCDDCHNLRAA